MSSKNCETNGHGHELGLLIVLHLLPLNCVFHILQQMGAKRKVFDFQITHIYLNKIASFCNFFGLESASLNPKVCGRYSVCLSHSPTSTNHVHTRKLCCVSISLMKQKQKKVDHEVIPCSSKLCDSPLLLVHIWFTPCAGPKGFKTTLFRNRTMKV